MKKIFFIIFALLSTNSVFAGNDQLITCNSSSCSKDTSSPLFFETNIFPGYQVSQSITVRNDRNTECQFTTTAIKSNPVDLLSDRMSLDITSSASSQYSGTISQFYLQPNYSLGTIPAGSTAVYIWSSQFDINAGNEYQNISSVFDLDLNFSCLDESASQSVSSSGGSVAGASVCSQPTPGAPSLYQAVENPDGSVLLSWNGVSQAYTHYLVSFGPDRDNFLYGAPNIGSDNQYLVQGITSGARYCFYVKAINDCAPGPASNVLCINEGSAPGENIPEGFEPGVLGEQTETSSDSVELGSIMGDSNSCTRFWLPLLFVLAFVVNLFFFNLVWSFVFSALLFAIDFYLLRSSCCPTVPLLCQYFWIGSILSYLVPFVFKNKRK
jgi:hypothetical protein